MSRALTRTQQSMSVHGLRVLWCKRLSVIILERQDEKELSVRFQSVGNRGGSANARDLANALGAHWIDVRILLIDPGHVDRADVGVGRDVVLSEVVVHVVA